MIFRFSTLFAISIASLVPILASAQSISNAEKHRDLIHDLLEQSLKYEIEAIKNSQTRVGFGARNEYFPQMRLRGIAGEHEQNERLFDALMDRHEERNRDRSIAFYRTRIGRYADHESSPEGVSEMIREGQLDQVGEILDDPDWGKQRPGENWNEVLVAERFWLASKLAAAHYRAGNADKVRECLNLARKIQEGEKFTGKEFDADDDWIPATPAEYRFGPRFQQRATFYWTLVQSGHAELAIKWFLADKVSQSENAVFVSSFGLSKDVRERFVEMVARRHSPLSASELATQLYGKSIPATVHTGIAKAALSINEIPVATSHVEATLNGLVDEPVVILYPHVEMLGSLVEHNQDEFASVLLGELLGRVEKLETATKTGEPHQELRENENWKHVIYAFLAREAVKFDKNSAMKLVDLFENTPEKGEWDRWVLIESIKAKCGKISKEKHDKLTGNCFADDLIGAYLDSNQLEIARQTIKDAAVRVRKNTHSGNSISDKGLAVLDYNAHERILLARRAIRFQDFQLARDLLDEIPSNYSRREGYRAVTLRIAETWGVERSKVWMEQTKNPISKSGAILGLVEFLLPEPEELDDIPRAFYPAC